jgi:hypothetical protein
MAWLYRCLRDAFLGQPIVVGAELKIPGIRHNE